MTTTSHMLARRVRLFLLLLVVSVWLYSDHNLVVGLSVRRAKPRESTRYFSQQLLVPPLEPIDEDAESSLLYIQQKTLPVLYTNDPHAVSQWLLEHVDTINGCMLGFDVECVPDAPWVRRRARFFGPATVQLATTQAALVIHMVKPDGRPSHACIPLLEAILMDETIVKAGCGIDDDMLGLRDHFEGIQEAYGRFELKGICATEPGQTIGLKRLTAWLLGLRLLKSKKLTASDWSQVPLSQAQIMYSARDAWAGAAIAAKLNELEPETFATERVLERLRSSKVRSLRELEDERHRRKEAKRLLKILRKLPSIANGPLASLRLNLFQEVKRTLIEYRREPQQPIYQLDLARPGNYTI